MYEWYKELIPVFWTIVVIILLSVLGIGFCCGRASTVNWKTPHLEWR